ncbi:MAG: hypothetical protein ACREFQ_00315 [Stellaceae bacterium]
MEHLPWLRLPKAVYLFATGDLTGTAAMPETDALELQVYRRLLRFEPIAAGETKAWIGRSAYAVCERALYEASAGGSIEIYAARQSGGPRAAIVPAELVGRRFGGCNLIDSSSSTLVFYDLMLAASAVTTCCSIWLRPNPNRRGRTRRHGSARSPNARGS